MRLASKTKSEIFTGLPSLKAATAQAVAGTEAFEIW